MGAWEEASGGRGHDAPGPLDGEEGTLGGVCAAGRIKRLSHPLTPLQGSRGDDPPGRVQGSALAGSGTASRQKEFEPMQVTRRIATPCGDGNVGATEAAMPLEGSPTVSYGRYFAALEAFLARDGWAALGKAGVDIGGVDRLVLRAEKHGALYHPASVEAGGVRLCVNVAVEPTGMACLQQEAGSLAVLRERYAPQWLPCPYATGEAEGMAFLLEEWFGGFHEFHSGQDGRVRLWDFDRGERVLAPGETLAVYRQAARILTRYFDVETGARIGPWHHAAGDFVARIEGGAVEVRCITVRGHAPAGDFSQAGPMAGRLALLSFFLTMTMAMRLDRVDGVGALRLAGEDVAEAAVAGFAEALGERSDLGEASAEALGFLASFGPQELEAAARQVAEPFAAGEAPLVDAAWAGHATALCRALTAWRP